jgi:hypothetical protein
MKKKKEGKIDLQRLEEQIRAKASKTIGNYSSPSTKSTANPAPVSKESFVSGPSWY